MQTGWEIRGDELWLVDPAGIARVPPFQEIYDALVDRRPSAAWIPTSVDGLKACRYPLVPKIVIAEVHEGIPTYSVAGNCRGIEIELERSDLERGHKISAGVWYPIDAPSAAEVLELLQRNSVSLGRAHSLKAYLALCKAALGDAAVENRMANRPISPLAFAPPGDSLPEGIKATLYEYQLIGWRWLKFLVSEEAGGLLADEMGLGKTLQVIGLLSDAGEVSLKPALIVAPGSLLENWRREINRFAPHLRVLKHHGALRTGSPAELQRYDIIVTSYDTVVGDNSLLNMIRWRVVVLDEAQFIRNPNAQRTRSVKRLKRDSGLAVTGTPIENKLMDLWSIMDFVLPGHLGDVKSFEAAFPDNLDSAARLEPLVSPLMLRRRVADVAKDLPARIDIPQILDLDDDEASAYDAELARINNEYGAAATLVSLTSLRRFCAHPSLMSGAIQSDDPMSFSKFRRLHEIIDEIFERGEKVLIFTSFTAMADMIARHVQQRFKAFAGVVDGRLPIDDRQPLIDAFSAIEGPAALVLNPRAGGAGLNITAANHVIHYNPEWNPALEDQASARAHRRGQELTVTVHRLLIGNTVEDVVDARLARKRALSGTAVIGVEGKDDDYGDIATALSLSPSKRTFG